MNTKKSTKIKERETNRKAVYNLIRTQTQMTKSSIAYQLHLSLPTVNQHIQDLLAEDLIFEDGILGDTGGRRAKAFSCLTDKKVAFGIDVTPHHIIVLVLDLTGQIKNHIRVRYDFEYKDHYFKKLGELIHESKLAACIEDKQVLGVGIALPALTSSDHTTIVSGLILGITGATVADFGKYIPYPTKLFNEPNAGCFAETWTNKDFNTGFFIALGNNIGGALVINSAPYTGTNYRSGEIGLMVLHEGGLPCYCGKNGCFDSYCSVSFLTAHSNGSLDDFFTDLRQGKEPHKSVWNEYLKNLALAVNNVRMLFDCQIIIGGYMGAYLEEYLEDLRTLVYEKDPFISDMSYLQTCTYKIEPFAAGAGLTYIDEFIKSV